MAIELFGFTIGRTQKENEAKEKLSFALPQYDDGAIDVAGTPGGAYGTYLDMEGAAKNETDLIARYRQMSLFPECELAVDDIVNEAVVADREESAVSINLENINLSLDIKQKIVDNFHEVVDLLQFNQTGYDTFKKWYVDGRLYYHIIIDPANPKRGILELRPIDSLKIKKVRQVIPPKSYEMDKDPNPKIEEYFAFNEGGISGDKGGNIIRIAPDSIAYCHSGLLSEDRKMVLSYLHKAIKPLNQLRMIEDAVVIYRISRAPERRIFYIDVGNLPKIKAEQYLRDIMTRYKNKLVYDSATGELRDDRKHMSMLEDYWLPRREGGRGTEISTLPGGENLGELEDVIYFQRKLYKSLNVPSSRLEQDSGFVLGRAQEISRDEVKFTRFIERLRSRFNGLFNTCLEKQLILKGILTLNDWRNIQNRIHYEWQTDSQFAELKEAEMLQERLNLLQSMNFADEIVGNFYSKEYVRKRILKQTQEEIDEIDRQIAAEGGGEEEEGEDQFQSFKPENGQNLSEELDKIVEEKIVDKEKDEELKENLNEIFKSVLEEETDEFRAI
ncbi:MAG: portal protein [Flavobacteriaceae bacterium]|nr:portal protein [Flavobacteriaceae bacterium]